MNSNRNLCPICLNLFKAPLISKCGHSFCESCIHESLKTIPKCPVCNLEIDSENLFPNLALQSLQKQIEVEAEQLKHFGRRRTVNNNNLSDEIVREFFAMLEEEKTSEFVKLQKQLERIKQLKERLDIVPKITSIGSKRKASEIRSETDDAKLLKLKENLPSILNSFSEKTEWETLSTEIKSFTKLYNCNELSSFCNGDSLSVASQIISSIEADRQGYFFATAGVLKQINLFNLNEIIENASQASIRKYPILEIKCESKISCLSWNPFYDDRLCSVDYSGVLNLYDTSSGQLINTWDEHEKRCWSVDTSSIDPQKIITGSDDCKVKLWSLKNPKSLLTLDIRANVCSVRFSPIDPNIVAVGAADHRVFLFDLRKPSIPLFNEKRHSKSVSYVRFANSEGDSLLSASTDSSLKLLTMDQRNSWNVSRTFHGHLNEKNFVGLSVNGDNGLIATGSEDNCVIIYDQNLEYPVLKYPLMTECPLTGKTMEDEQGTFVSSVSWTNRLDDEGNSVLLAANSTGNVKILSISEE